MKTNVCFFVHFLTQSFSHYYYYTDKQNSYSIHFINNYQVYLCVHLIKYKLSVKLNIKMKLKNHLIIPKINN